MKFSVLHAFILFVQLFLLKHLSASLLLLGGEAVKAVL
ncbi:hypothetical protein STRDD11_01510 [Streptococcus sp. DD11]|nr:hypothetical protein STRDD11_01510 [Streptococcus sp. DD11]